MPTGPLTNVALLLALHPDARPERIVLMGGAIAEGNVTPAAEFNIWCDPEAAARVFASGIDVTMIGLDITHKALFTPAHAEKLEGRVGAMVSELLRFYGEFHRTVYNFDGSPIHDAVAVAHVLRPGLVETDPLARRLQAVALAEPAPAETLALLLALRERLARHHQLDIEPSCVGASVRAADALPGYFPAKALTLLIERLNSFE